MANPAIVQACPLSACQAARSKVAELKGWREDADVAGAAYERPPPKVIGKKTLVTDRAELAKIGLEPEDLSIPDTNFGAVVYKEGEPRSRTFWSMAAQMSGRPAGLVLPRHCSHLLAIFQLTARRAKNARYSSTSSKVAVIRGLHLGKRK
jgi:hypothetical protein